MGALKNSFIIIILFASSCHTDKSIAGKYLTDSNLIESGSLTINESETNFTYEWKEHLASGLTRGKIEKVKGNVYLTSYIDTLKNNEAVVLRRKSERSNLTTINFYTIDSLITPEVVFTLLKGGEKYIVKTDSFGVFSIKNLIGEVFINQNLEFEPIHFCVDYTKDNLIFVYLVPNKNTIQYKHFKHMAYKIKRKKLLSNNGGVNFTRY
jgi:hypothetical protein